MYDVKFIPARGTPLLLGTRHHVAFDIDAGAGMSVDIATAQGFRQVGTTPTGQSVGGKKLRIKGCIMHGSANIKDQIRKAFAPMQSGQLIFDGRYSVNVLVAESPTFSEVKGNGKFMMQLYAPYPYWQELRDHTEEIGLLKPGFFFPINYHTPHNFGIKSQQKWRNIINSGNLPVPFDLTITATGACPNITLTNLQTLQMIRFNGTLQAGEEIHLTHDAYGQTIATLVRGGIESSAISQLDDESSLEELQPGDNIINATDDNDGANLTVKISYREAVASVYETDAL